MGFLTLQCGKRYFDLWDADVRNPRIWLEVSTLRDRILWYEAVQSRITSIYGFAIKQDSYTLEHFYSLASGAQTRVHAHSAVCIGAQVIYAQGWHVACIDGSTGSVVWQRKSDAASCLGVYALPEQGAIIVHGELAITKLSLNGDNMWQVVGEDAFTGPFHIDGDEIVATDFRNTRYVVTIADGHITTSAAADAPLDEH